MVVVLGVDRAGEETTGTGGTDSTRIGLAMASQAPSHTHTLTIHHHRQGGTGVVGVVPGSRDIGDVTTGIAMKDTEEETVGDTVVGTGDMNTKIVVIVLKYEICQKNVWLYRKWQILMESLVSAGTKNANFTFPFFF